MSEDKNHKKLLMKYLKGTLSDLERNELEKAALDDPFLYEAMEGASAYPDGFDSDLNFLETKIQKQKSLPWIKIAASLAIIISASIALWYFLNDSPKTNPTIALEEDITRADRQPDLPDGGKEIVEEDDILPEMVESPDDHEQIAQAFEIPVETDLQENDQTEKQDIATLGKSDRNITKGPEKEDTIYKMAEATDVGDELKETDAFSRSNTPTLSKRSITKSETKAEEEIELSLDVEITERAVLEDNFFEETPNEIMNNAMISDVEPLIGWDNYMRYLNDSLRLPDNAKSANTNGRVYVQVEIDGDGAVYNATILKGFEEAYNKEALRLINEGPGFKPDSMDRTSSVVITIEF